MKYLIMITFLIGGCSTTPVVSEPDKPDVAEIDETAYQTKGTAKFIQNCFDWNSWNKKQTNQIYDSVTIKDLKRDCREQAETYYIAKRRAYVFNSACYKGCAIDPMDVEIDTGCYTHCAMSLSR